MYKLTYSKNPYNDSNDTMHLVDLTILSNFVKKYCIYFCDNFRIHFKKSIFKIEYIRLASIIMFIFMFKLFAKRVLEDNFSYINGDNTK